jgi:hypothetical protein
MMVLGAVMAVAVAGAVFAARPDDAPPVDPPKPPMVAEKPAEQPPPKPDPDPKPAAFTTEPKLQRAFDLPVLGISRFCGTPPERTLQSADGSYFRPRTLKRLVGILYV